MILNAEVLRILDRGFNEEDIYNGINDIKYLFNENEDNITCNTNIKYRGIKDIRYLFNENEDK